MTKILERWQALGRLRYMALSIALVALGAIVLSACDVIGGSQSLNNGGGYDKGSGAAVALTPRPGQDTNVVAPRVGASAPNIELTTYDGKKMSLGDVLKSNKVVLVNFWASWCPPCRAEMPDIEATYSRFRSQGFTVLGVNMQESADQVSQYAQAGGYDFPLLLDSDATAAGAYRVSSLPTSYFVTSDGIIKMVNYGAMTQVSLEDKLQQLGLSK
jgi:cytochrome c biogenesis protein CcmG, thiol:disulfide interchange protein DsbE